jgi:hypothetical protein
MTYGEAHRWPTDMSRSTSVAREGSGALPLILRVGLIAGTLDISDALIFSYFRGATPVRVFQFIASGLIGLKSFQLGWMSVVLGVGIHYFIALTWTAVFYFASRKFTVLIRRPVVSGLLFGIAVYLFMNLIALPLSGVPHSTKPITLASRVNGVLAVMFCIGLTIALLIRRSSANFVSR